MSIPFADRVCARILERRTALVVGLDPVLELFPEELQAMEVEQALVRFGQGVLSAIEPEVAAVKPQIAFFERHGWRGLRAFQRLVEEASRLGIPVIVDCKRGDVGSTAEAYAEAFLGEDPETPGPYVDAVTLNPYLGEDSMEPFRARAIQNHRGLFLLSRTSNPGGAQFQERKSDGEPLYLAVARAVHGWGEGVTGAHGYGPFGLVAGATYPEALREIRAAAPDALLLVPGLGFQGGDPHDLAVAFDARGLGALVSASRSVIYAYKNSGGTDWEAGVREAAQRTRKALERARSGACR
ncbi:MAG: orotidine-5'-phosphate decarboxylase [Planctomycetota bacterium]